MDPTLLALLVQMMSADSTGASKGTNTMQDALFSMLLDPSFGILTDTYDPMLTVQPANPDSYAPPPEVGMPITMSYVNSGGKMGEIAQGLLGGEITFDQALRDVENATADQNSELYGQDVTDLKAELNTLRTEINDYSAKAAQAQFAAGQIEPRTDEYAKRGLPLPSEQYTADTMNPDGYLASRRSDIDQMMADYAKRLADFESKPIPEVSSRASGRTGSPSANAQDRPEPDQAAPQSSVVYDMVWQPKWEDPTALGTIGLGPTNPYRLAPRTVEPSAADVTASQPSSPMWKMIDPEWTKQKKALQYEGQKLGRASGLADVYAEGRAGAASAQGRSPYSDAMSERTKQLAPLLALFLNQ